MKTYIPPNTDVAIFIIDKVLKQEDRAIRDLDCAALAWRWRPYEEETS